VTHSEDIPINRRNLQSKLFDYMAAGKPIVLGCDGEMRNLIENAGAGIWVGAQQPERMAQAILRLKNEPVLRTQLGQAGREYALRHLSRERVALEYLMVFRHIITEGGKTQDHRINKSGKESCPRQRQ
jgi:glycosyltransferase involved in cell wall biosynthesis